MIACILLVGNERFGCSSCSFITCKMVVNLCSLRQTLRVTVVERVPRDAPLKDLSQGGPIGPDTSVQVVTCRAIQ